MKSISLIIPTWNEEGNIKPLVERIDQVLQLHNIKYELIFVDDHSTDNTRDIINELSENYPLQLFLKEGSKGKAYSLIEGFSKAKYELVGMIDADLQYPPEAIPEMVSEIDRCVDIVVANRKEQHISFIRQVTSKTFRKVFGEWLHGLNVDVQSGLKVFRREIAKRIKVNPSPWTFDMEFLLKSRDAGYVIGSVDIDFVARRWGESKVDTLKTSLEIGLSSIKLKFIRPEIIPFLPEWEKKEGIGFHHKGNKYTTHSSLKFAETAFYRITTSQGLILISILVLFISGLFWQWHMTLIVTVAALTSMYFADLIFNLFLVYRSLSKVPEIEVSEEEILAESDWPSYTIFCPLYKEWEVLPQFVTAMNRLDYPKSKLQILLLLEENDQETINKAKEFNLPDFFKIVVVPHSHPKTKPKACNYGLQLATGEYAVIFDAEDIPEADQLKKAVIAFKKVGEKISCIQAKLNFYNPHQNILTKVFTAEYSLWFDLVLPGLQSLGAPIPLGGTSNHFKTQELRDLEGWDAFNVTEDCDLGIRLTKLGLQTAIINSTTMEEANSSFKNWLPQRIRWIKGYIQTYLVHMRNPRNFIKSRGIKNFAMFQLVVGGKILSMFINPFMWLTTAAYFIARSTLGHLIESLYPAPIFYMGVFSLVVGNFLYFYNYMIGCAKRQQFEIIKYAFLVPFYWLGMSLAAWMALYKMISQPHYWAKTQHGLHLNNQKAIEQAKQVVGGDLVDERLLDLSVQS